ncbi:MAG: DMT family transporter [Rhodospirillales bacterium]|nr:DMT family transporter [Rhodospirillales bacterium]
MAISPSDSAAAPVRANRPLVGIVYMIGGVFVMSVMDAIAKFAVGHVTSIQIMGIRSTIVFVLMIGYLASTGQLAQLRTRRPLAHLLRGLAAAGSMWCFFESLRALPLATAIAICFAAPLLMTAYSVVLLRERVGFHRWTAVVVGFAGVGVIIGPEAADGIVSAGAVLALGAAALYALGMTMVRWLSPTESDVTMIVLQCFVQMSVGLVGMMLVPGSFDPVPGPAWIAIGVMSVFLIFGQFLSYRAFRLAPVGAIAPFNYTELVWAAIIGWFIWGEWPTEHVWYGASIVVAAGLYVIWRERVRAREAAAAATA